MAEIDKILPNVSQNVNLPSASKVALEQQQQMAEQMKQPSELPVSYTHLTLPTIYSV